jgi:hypothetical protein
MIFCKRDDKKNYNKSSVTSDKVIWIPNKKWPLKLIKTIPGFLIVGIDDTMFFGGRVYKLSLPPKQKVALKAIITLTI